MDLRGKYDATDSTAYTNELKQLISASHDAWGKLHLGDSAGFPAVLNQYIAESNFEKCDKTNFSNWLDEKCETFDRMMQKKDTDSYIGKCLKGTVKISQSDANTGPCAFQGYISGDYDVRAQFGTTLDTATHAIVTDCSDAAKKLTEGRTVEFWGFVIGSYTYTTTSNGSQTIPAFKMLASR